MTRLDPVFVWSNYAECGLWVSLGVASLLFARSGARFWLGGTLLLFGVSDWVEAHTGAWYRPWWLFVWKALCVLVLLIAIVPELRARRGKRDPQAPADAGADRPEQ